MEDQRGHWSSSIGFVLAATGSAVGLGNLWKFPFITWENNGGAFVIVYLLCIAAVGLPIMMAELLIGRKTQKSPVGALKAAVGPFFRVALAYRETRAFAPAGAWRFKSVERMLTARIAGEL